MVVEPEPDEVRLSVEGGLVPLGPSARACRVVVADLAPQDAARLRVALEAAAGPASDDRLSGMPDVRIYRLQLPGRTAVFDDVTATPEEHALVGLVSELAAR
jgi:hypothetical protein